MTTLAPGKLELLSEWIPQQAWYIGDGSPRLANAGGFRLDDPAGEVGIEFIFVTDDAGSVTYQAPMAYRSGPIAGAESALLGTSQHGVLGQRWFYDGGQDAVVQAQLLALLRGEVIPQHQKQSHTPDPTVTVQVADGGRLSGADVELVRVLTADAGEGAGDALAAVIAEWTLSDGTAARGRVALLR
jgi:hypothetical protein